MNTYIAFLRGINVGGSTRLPMQELIALLEKVGAKEVRTYLQSGNAVFRCAEADVPQLPERLSAAIKKRHRFEAHIFLLGVDAISEAMANNPFPEAESDPSSLHLGFLASTPKSPDMEKLNSLKRESERFQLRGRVFYLHAPEGVGRSRLAANSERLLGVPMTDRNLRTVRKIRALAEQ